MLSQTGRYRRLPEGLFYSAHVYLYPQGIIYFVINIWTNRRRSIAIAAALVAVALLLSVFGSPGALAAGTGAQGALTVVRQTAEIDYGKKISVHVVVDIGSRTTKTVRALLRPRGGSTIWSYSYPGVSVDGSHATIKFEISTGPGSYYPPGTDFDIEIEVTYENGDVASVRSGEPIEYLDPAKPWERTTGDGYTILHYGVSSSTVNNLVAQTNSRIGTLKSVLGVGETPDFKAVVFPSVREATPSFPPVSQTATDQFVFAGFAQPQYRLFVQGEMNPTTFIHELAHLYTHEAVSSSLLGGLPAWLNEGLARFLETGSTNSSNARLRSSVRPDELLSLRNMGTVPGQRSDVFIFYPQAG
ncbi:MAG: hypothetical protein O3B95_09405, partial [Chloroflexi bacterium]|nr:hypothetical protein [Chloroflexota bacterium]